eukprot:CAMPEP_0118707264 /NCGR_PEP_ID=MMETSP0800-20121206/21091_1 /TAXON_ID=210618 ORGANISM="Striatella unipunctata, Strain CCMP2910" /NCGR_SAMPLE_ID=MMETSP0800 /ASSEMBLY_ACC=CAM_ASM_000638 /LENGTH=592 /DNA_ID=CAMNT_0006610039 /DNA_START=272 /DNA_END=2047 /DNA_ORIENTATION=+
MGPSTPPLPPMPAAYEVALRQKLQENVGFVFREARSLTKRDDFSDRGQHLAPHVKLMADAMWEGRLCLFDEAFHMAFTPEEARKNILNGNDESGIERAGLTIDPVQVMTPTEKQNLRKQSQWDAVQESFLETYVFMLRNYRKYMVYPSKDNVGSYGGAGFRSKEFVQGQRHDMQQFLDELVGTQMFDDFVTKRLYGSGKSDVMFFDMAVDRFLKNAGIMSNVAVNSRIRRASGVAAMPAPSLTNSRQRVPRGLRGLLSRSASFDVRAASKKADKEKEQEEPLLQSSRVRRKLKTIVPPEPSSDNLPKPTGEEEGVAEVLDIDDQQSVGSAGSSGTKSSVQTGLSSLTQSVSLSRSPSRTSKKTAKTTENEKKYQYVYEIFPPEFNPELFGTPRPLPSAVMDEFIRQREDAARFRRKTNLEKKRQIELGKVRRNPSNLEYRDKMDKPPSAEVSTFTLFFMAFTAFVGKELLEVSHNPLLHNQDRTIWSTWTPPTVVEDDDDDATLESEAVNSESKVDKAETPVENGESDAKEGEKTADETVETKEETEDGKEENAEDETKENVDEKKENAEDETKENVDEKKENAEDETKENV